MGVSAEPTGWNQLHPFSTSAFPGLRLTFPGSAELAAALASLAAAEQDCCAFFDFTLNLAPPV